MNLDVQINGASIVQDGVANIPYASASSFGVVKYLSSFGLTTNNGGSSGYLSIMQTSRLNIDNRGNAYQPIAAPILDYAVKAAMCDGKGAAWTADEQAAARERMGIDEWEDILDVTLEEDSAFNLDLNGSFRHLYAYIDQTNVEEPVVGTFCVMPTHKDTKNNLYSYGPPTTSVSRNIAGIWSFYGTLACRQMITVNAQYETTGAINNTLKTWDKNNYPKFPNSPFTGFASSTTFKTGTKITIKGVRA